MLFVFIQVVIDMLISNLGSFTCIPGHLVFQEDWLGPSWQVAMKTTRLAEVVAGLAHEPAEDATDNKADQVSKSLKSGC